MMCNEKNSTQCERKNERKATEKQKRINLIHHLPFVPSLVVLLVVGLSLA